MNKLYFGDCIDIMKTIEGQSIDFILTDLPYGVTNCKWDSIIPFDLMWKELKRIQKNNTVIALFGTEPFSSKLRMSNIDMFKYDWIWKKNRPSGMLNAKHQPMRNHEIISVFYSKSGKYYPIKEKRGYIPPKNAKYKCYSKNNTQNNVHHDTDFKILDELRYPTTVKEFDSIANRKEMLHPTQKPLDLIEYLIQTYTLENETVLDFTMGSGTTGVACKNLSRNFIGIENNKEYFEIAENQINGAN